MTALLNRRQQHIGGLEAIVPVFGRLIAFLARPEVGANVARPSKPLNVLR